MLTTVDPQKVEAFGNKLLGMMNGGALALMISIGHRTGLFDVLSGMAPAASKEIAAQAKLNERYVREWLGAMVTGDIVRYDPASEKYSLPPEHAACLTRAAAPNNIAAFTQYFAVLGEVEDRIVECFRKGGGVPYSGFPRFQEVMAEESYQTIVSALLSNILPLAPGLLPQLEKGIDVLDLGCGSGRAINSMAVNFPKSRFTGYDLSRRAIATAKDEAARAGLRNVRFKVQEVSKLKEQDKYDLITAFDAIHDQVAPDRVLKNIFQALRSDGLFLMQDIKGSSQLENNLHHPYAPFLYTVSCMHCMTVSLAEGGMGLGAMWGKEKAMEMLRVAGFTQVEVRELPHDFQNYYYLVKK